jgi:acyl-CoA reductase-like NAD-dependent aldehyde dehydrogenase
MQDYPYFVAGEFRKGREKIGVVNPVTEEQFATICETTQEDLALALSQAQIAQREWRQASFKERANVLREISRIVLDNLSELAALETKEIGKPLKESLLIDIPLGADCFTYYASFLETLQEKIVKTQTGADTITYDPYGICAVYLPYNVPLMIFGFSCAASLAAGNALVIKPSEFGSLSVLRLMQHLNSLDIPKGLISVVTGRGQTVGASLAGGDIDIISFTGSRETLKKIIAVSGHDPKKIICELGGSNLAVIFSDADREQAVQNVLGSSFLKQGQMCIGTSVVLLEEGIYTDFVRDLLDKVSTITVGDPFLPEVGMGPLPTREHLESVHARVKALEKKGGKILFGGSPIKGKGYFYPPTIIEVDTIIFEEFFAPVILMKKCTSKEIEDIIEKNPTGLVLQIWSNNMQKAWNIAHNAQAGTVWINTFAQMSSQTPFGGMKKSGWGRNLGEEGFFEYVQPKHIGIGFKKSPVDGWFGL